MSSNPPFELEDQTDEDFFDKLVNDDDDDDDVIIGGGGGGGVKSAVSVSGCDDVSDGNESDEAKAFANLSLSESGSGSEVVGVTGSVGCVEEQIGEVTERVVGSEGITGVQNVGATEQVVGSDHGVGEQSPEAKEQPVVDGYNVGERIPEEKEQPVQDGQVVDQLVSSDSFSFDNGHVLDNGVVTTEAMPALRSEGSSGSGTGGVKEVTWSSFNDMGSGEFGSYSDLFGEFGDVDQGKVESEGNTIFGNGIVENTNVESSCSHAQYQGDNGAVAEQSASGADTNDAQYWESAYPGWKFDSTTGQWYQVDNFDGTSNGQENSASGFGNMQGNFDVAGDSQWAVSDVQASHVSNAQQSSQSAVETASHVSTTENVSSWNQTSQQNGEYQYPAHMVFDPQYPGWYYDTIAQEWRQLDTYHSSVESKEHSHYQQGENGFVAAEAYSHDTSDGTNTVTPLGLSSEGQNQSAATSFRDYSQQGTNAYQSEVVKDSWPSVSASGGVSWQGAGYSSVYSNSYPGQQMSSVSREPAVSYDKTNHGYDSSNWVGGLDSFVPGENAFNHTAQGKQNGPVQYSNDYYGSQNAAAFQQPLFPNGHHVAYAPTEGRSPHGRPPHALVTFGFGGKLVVMRDTSTGGFSSFGSKDSDGRSISVLNLMEVVGLNNGPSGTGAGACSYFHSLCHQSFPGPLVGGNAGSKELNKWVDERIANCVSLHVDDRKSEALKLLLSLLKIACQHYGKLRSHGANTGLMEKDLPESDVAKLFSSSRSRGGQFGATSKCFTTLPSEAQIQTTATEVQNLLICGRKKEALQRAQEGQFWEFALILARELGEQFYVDTVKQMAVSQLVVGSPLRTLCLLIAKKPEEVFSSNIMAAGDMHGAVTTPAPSAQNVGYSMLDNWEENLAVITANRTENDHLVIIHLGDCLWKEKIDVTAAHICYLVAEADLEAYSDSARLCLIGADHWNFPRTYASPEAIQRTELFEYAKVLGNSQFVLHQLQPYKLIYAHMLAEVGRVSDSLKYCQAAYKSLKTGRSAEAETLKQLLASLEERVKTHQQSGYAANLAPAKIMGKLFNFIDSTAHRVVGGLPPPVPSATQGVVQLQGNEHHFQTSVPKVSTSQSLTPSASMEPISQWAVDGSRTTMPSRSVSEPDIGRTPKPTDSANEATSSSSERKSGTTGKSRFGGLNFGAQILQKTVGLVLKPRTGRQAKLGETNKFYYDEKLKKWVEEGAEPSAEESAPPPPPTTAAFQNGMSGYNSINPLNNGLHAAGHSPESTNSTPLGSSSAIPAIPPSSNQFSARGRMGVRSRYVDTFNKGSGASTNLFQTPSVPSVRPSPSAAGAKFFIPAAPSPSNEQTLGTESGNEEKVPENGENPSGPTIPTNDPFQNLAPSPAGTMQRFPSVDNIPNNKGMMGSGYSSLPSQSRRTASWNEIHGNAFTPPTTTELKASPLSFMPNHQPPGPLPMNGVVGSNFGDDLQEVEL